MRNRFKRYLSLFVTLCMLTAFIPNVAISEEAASAAASPSAPVQTVETPVPDAQPSASTEATVKPEDAPPADGSQTLEPIPAHIVALTGAPSTLEAIYGCDEDELDLPESLTAVYSDDTQARLSVRWVCISDGLGGTAYDGECENYEDARFSFEARLPEGALCAEGLTLPRVQVQLVLPDNSNISTYDGDAPIVVGGISISNSEGVLSYTCRSDFGFEIGQRWYRGDKLISSDQTYTLTMDDMKAGATIRLFVDMSTGDSPFLLTAEYSIADNNTDWSYDTDTDTLTIKEDNGHKSKDFPFTDWDSVKNVVIDENVEVIGLNISVSGNVTVKSRAEVSGSTIKCETLTVQENAIVAASTKINAQHVVNNGTIEIRLKVMVYDANNGSSGFYDFTVNYESQNLYTLLSEKASSADNIKDGLAALGDYVWTLDGDFVSPDAELELSMNGALFDAVALPALKIEYNGAELAKDGEAPTSLHIGSTLNAVPDTSLEGFNPSDYTWKIGDATIGSGASLTIPATITVDGMLIPLALQSGDLTCTAKYGEKTLNSPSYPVRLELVLNPEPTLVSSTETEEKTVYTTATVLSFSPEAEALKAQYGLSDVKYAWGRSEADVASPVDGAGATYTLTPDDLIGGEKTIYGAMFLYKGDECKQYVASYTIPANDVWTLVAVSGSANYRLIFFGNYDQATTAFPVSDVFKISSSCQEVYVNSGVTVSGANLFCGNSEVIIDGTFSGGSIECGTITVNFNNDGYNPGKVSDCTIKCGNMTIGHYGTVSGSKIDCGSHDLIIKDDGTASNCTITCGNMTVYGGGMVSGGSIECGQTLRIEEDASVTRLTLLTYGTLSKDRNGTLSVMAHAYIDDESDTPVEVELTFGENLIDELNAAAGITGAGKIWYIKNVDDTCEAIAASDTVSPLHCGITFKCMDAPTLSLNNVNEGGTLHVGDTIAIDTANVPEGVTVALVYKYGDNCLYVDETPSRDRDSTYFVPLPATYRFGNMCLAGGFELYACVRSMGNEVVGSDPVNVTILPKDGSITKAGTKGVHKVGDKLSFALPDGESFDKPYCLDVLSTEWTVGEELFDAENDGSLKLSLDLLGSCSEARTVRYTVKLKNPATMAEFTVSATYELPANEVWTYDAGSETLTVIGDYDGTKTDNPYPLPALSGRDSVIIEEGASLRGVKSLFCYELTNYGTIGSPDSGIHLNYASGLHNCGEISYCTISSDNESEVYNAQGGKISNCEFYVRIENRGEISDSTLREAVTNQQGGTIHDCSTVDAEPVQNIGTIYDCTFGKSTLVYNYHGGTIYGSTFGNNSRVENNEGEIHVPLTINGKDYTSTPTSGVKFLYGESALAALEAQYESVHGAGSAANCVWLDADGNELTDQTLGLYGNSFTFLGTLSCSIDAPTGYFVGSTLYANIALETEIEGVTTSYEWLDERGVPFEGSKANAQLEIDEEIFKAYQNQKVTLKVVVEIPNVGSVSRTVTSISAICNTEYDVKFDYANDALMVIPIGDKQIASIAVSVTNASETVSAVSGEDGKWILPLNGIGEGKIELYLWSVKDPNGKWLFGPAMPYAARANAPVGVRVTPVSGDPGKVTVSWDSGETLEFRNSITGESFGKRNSGDTIELPADVDVTLSVRTPGNSVTRTLPSKWGDVATIKASDLLYLNVVSQYNLSGRNTLFWGEVLDIDATAGATLTWRINGQYVEAPALVDGKYSIPAGTTSLSITATDGSGNSITRELSVKSPISTRLDYEHEVLILWMEDDFNRIPITSLKIEGNPESSEFVNLADHNEHGMTVYPEGNGPHPLSITMKYGGNTYQSQMVLPRRFQGSTSELGIETSGGVDFNTDTGKWTGVTITPKRDSANIVQYTAIQLRGNNNTTIDYVPGDDNTWSLPSGGYFDGNVTYTVYAKQSDIEYGNWFTFESEWFDTGISFTVAPTWLSNTEPLVGDVVAAGYNFHFSDGMTWQWYLVDENGDAEKINSVTGVSCWVAPEYAGKKLRLALEYNGEILFYLDTEVIPEARLILTRKNGEESEELETDDNGHYIAYLGDVIYAEVENVSEEFLKDADVDWSGRCNEHAIGFEGTLVVDEGVLAHSFANIKAIIWKPASQEIELYRRVNFYIAPAPEVTIDYENETLVVAQPEKPLPEGYALCAYRGFGKYVFSSGVVDNKYTVPIASVDSRWPDSAKHTVPVYWMDAANYFDKPVSASANVIIPARPEVQMLASEAAAYAITVKGVSTQDYNFRLTAENATSPDADAVATPSDVNGDVKFTGLEANTTYRLWMQTKATDSAFRSAWISDTVTTGSGSEVTPSLASPTFDPDGFALYEDDLKQLLKLSFVNSPMILLGFRPTDVTLTRADGKPFPITEAGTYPLKLTLNGALADNNRLTTETVILTVNPYTVTDYRFSNEKIYTGAVMDPYAFELKVGGRVLTDKDYTIAVLDHRTLCDAGTYSATITFKGNYASENVEMAVLVISPRMLRVNASVQNREYDGTTDVKCTLAWADGAAPVSGDDVTPNLVSTTMEDAHAGTGKAVRVQLSITGAAAGNYQLEADELKASVDIAPRKLTVKPEIPADFVCNGSTNVPLSGEGWTLEGVLPGDDVRVNATGARASVSDPRAGANKPVTFTGIALSGANAADYAIGSVAARSVTILPADETVFAVLDDAALQACLNGMDSLVYNAAYEPVDYAQVPLLAIGEAEERILLICASQEESGEAVQRSLIVNAAQLVRLQQLSPESSIDTLIFENGHAAAGVGLAGLTGGNVAKLMARILSGEEITEEILLGDWSSVEDAVLSAADYGRFDLELCIAPVMLENGAQAYEVTVWLRHDGVKLNITALVDGLRVQLDASALVTRENAETFAEIYAVALETIEAQTLLESSLIQTPTASVDSAAEGGIYDVTGRDALTALHAGEGAYRIVTIE